MITLAKYAQDGSVTAIIDDQEISNITEANWRWAQVQEWVDAGNTITPYTPPVVPAEPISVAMWQARAALDNAGLLTQADAAVAASPNKAVRQYWQYATTLDEGNDFTKLFATTIGLTDKQMHDLFVTAAAIKV